MSEQSQKAGSGTDCRRVVRRLLKTRQAADYLGVSPWKLRQLAIDGALPYINGGDRAPWRFDLCDLEAYIEKNKQRELSVH
jgi:excisionase family DNA binding protein